MHDPPGQLLGRELALDVAGASFLPDMVTHVAGVAHVLADRFSRRFQPDARWSAPMNLLISLSRGRACVMMTGGVRLVALLFPVRIASGGGVRSSFFHHSVTSAEV